MTATMAGGGDWLDLPTQPIQHRGAAKPAGLPWDRITEEYVARGGQVDAGVWHQGKVQIVEGGGRGKDRVHTYAEGDSYQEPTAPAKKPRKRAAKRTEPAAPKRVVTDAERAEMVRLYTVELKNIPEIATTFGVGAGSVAWALRHTKTRSHAEGRAIAKARAAS